MFGTFGLGDTLRDRNLGIVCQNGDLIIGTFGWGGEPNYRNIRLGKRFGETEIGDKFAKMAQLAGFSTGEGPRAPGPGPSASTPAPTLGSGPGDENETETNGQAPWPRLGSGPGRRALTKI